MYVHVRLYVYNCLYVIRLCIVYVCIFVCMYVYTYYVRV